jgi:hypothetical protein
LDPNQNAVGLSTLNVPVVGQPLVFEVSGAPAASGGLLALGQLPFVVPLTAVDALLILPESAQLWPLFFTNPLGRALIPLDVPPLPALVGHALFFQAVVEPAVFSNGVAATFGG